MQISTKHIRLQVFAFEGRLGVWMARQDGMDHLRKMYIGQVYTQTRRGSLGSLEIFDFGDIVDTVWWKSGVVFLLK